MLGSIVIKRLLHLCVPGMLHNNVSYNLFAIDRIGATNGSYLLYKRKPLEHLFNLARGNIFATTINDFTQTTCNKQISIFILISQVTCAEPFILKSVLACVILICLNHSGTGDTDF